MFLEEFLEHSEACIETSSKDCRPDFRGFLTILNKTISQMKDYAQMYLEDIYKGRDKINDLDCVESVLSLGTYRNCFQDAFQNRNATEGFSEGIVCANSENSGCSSDAKTSLNRIVRDLVGIEQPYEEDIEEEIKPTEAPPMMWYDYIFQPFISAWNWLVGLFG
ncbi:uncharacterized protein CEXT_477091 [Caerostris extrusa]|uniref:Uncharacterized protein n=1 Tax=Caerostris extrusa TaxID=172846 RepID=A0AAV4XW30_CAEEX|nr:uncharacterized protein CEXT_477091 [Caerostris extrusa]